MATGEVRIRPVALGDAPDLRDHCFVMDDLVDIQSQVAANLERAKSGELVHLVAEVDGRVVGSVLLERHTHPLARHRADVAGLVVHQPYQRRGIARALVAECERQATALGLVILEISCRGGEPPERIYPRLGFIEYGRLPGGLVEPWGEGQSFDLVLFYLPL